MLWAQGMSMIDEIYAFRSLRSRAGRHKIEKKYVIRCRRAGHRWMGWSLLYRGSVERDKMGRDDYFK